MTFDGQHRLMLQRLEKLADRIDAESIEMRRIVSELLQVNDSQYQRELDEEKLAYWQNELDRRETHERDMDEERRAYWRAKDVEEA